MSASDDVNDDIVTTIWIDPATRADHSITVMRCGDYWWSYVDTTRIREDCASKERAIAAAKSHLAERYESIPARGPLSSAKSMEPVAKSGRSWARRAGVAAVWLIATMAIGALSVAAFIHRDVTTDFIGSFAVAENTHVIPERQTGMPPLPTKKAISTALITTGTLAKKTVVANNEEPETIAISNYQPTSTTLQSAAAGNLQQTTRAQRIGRFESNNFTPIRSRRMARGFNEKKSAYTPLMQTDRRSDSSIGSNTPREPAEELTTSEIDGEPIVGSSSVLTSARADQVSPSVDRATPVPLTKRQVRRKIRRSRNPTVKRHIRQKTRRKTRRRLHRRTYRGRRMFRVRRVRIGNRIVKIVRFRRPRTRREYRRLQSARNRIIAHHIRQRRRRYGY